MTNRKLSTIGLAVTAVAFLGVAGLALSEDKRAAAAHNDMMTNCAKACSDCQRACDACSTHCAHLLQEGKKEHHATLMSCQDCATVCAAASQVVARSGPYSTMMCATCAEVCAKCGTECEKYPNDMHMKMCAEECRKCEKSCREMAKGGHQH